MFKASGVVYSSELWDSQSYISETDSTPHPYPPPKRKQDQKLKGIFQYAEFEASLAYTRPTSNNEKVGDHCPF